MTIDLEQRRAALLARFSSWAPVTLDRFLDRCTDEFGARPLVITDHRTVTYAEVAAWAQRLADGLVDLGVGPGDRVGIVMANYVEFVPLKFAIARTGAVAVPFNYLYRRHELGYVLAQSECCVLVTMTMTMTSFADLDHLAMLDEIVPGWEAGGGSTLPALRHVVLFPTDGRWRDGVLDLDELDDRGRRHPGGAGGAANPEDPGDILYTSGTTGRPRASSSPTTPCSAPPSPRP